MKTLVTLLTLGMLSATAQAKSIQVFCKPNSRARISQFAGLATLELASDNTVKGTFQFATQVSHSAQSSAFKTINVTGKMEVIAAGELTKNEIDSFELQSTDREELHMHLNSGMPLIPESSTILVDRKEKFSAQCSVHADKSNLR